MSVDLADVTCIVITGKIRIPRLGVWRDNILYASMLGASAFEQIERMKLCNKVTSWLIEAINWLI
jgi:hypothetical protein